MRAAALLLAACTLAGCRQYEGPVSEHFDGERFHNAEPFTLGWRDLLRYYWERERGEWTRDLSLPPGPPPPAQLGEGALRLTYINHATVLIQADGLNLLTDPIWSERASPVTWAGPRRYRPPGIRYEDLPRIDVVMISHNHYDHLDAPTLRRLQADHAPLFVAGLGEGVTLRRIGLTRTVELDWDQATQLPNGCRLWGARARHWTTRRPGDRNRSLWLSYVLETRGGPLYFAGDTGYDGQFSEARARHGAMRAALLPIGAYLPRWLTEYQHMDPAQAVQAHRDLESAFSLGIHFGTFELSEEAQHQPPADLAAARTSQGISEAQFTAPEFGGGYDVPALSSHNGCSS